MRYFVPRFPLAPLVVLALLVGCSEKKPAPSAPAAPAKKPAPEPEPVVRYVQASTLKLRASPAKDGKVRGRVAINSPLEVLRDNGEFAQVRVKNGKEGFVAARFLGDTRVTVEDARKKAAESVEPAEGLSWLQRAAALEPTNLEVLDELRSAYHLSGNARAEGMVSKLMTKLKAVEAASRGRLLAAPGSSLEWSVLSDHSAPAAAELPKEEWAKHGLTPDAELWGLTSTGAAVRLTPRALRHEVFNECGGETGLSVEVGGAWVLAHLGAPPASWRAEIKPWAEAEVRALKERASDRCKEGWGCEVTVVANRGHGAFVRVMNERTEPEGEMSEFHLVELRATAPDAPLTELRSFQTSGYISGESDPVALRDVVGDDAPEIIFQGCDTVVRSLDGDVLFQSTFRCCGC